jgi:hypothetical protein
VAVAVAYVASARLTPAAPVPTSSTSGDAGLLARTDDARR